MSRHLLSTAACYYVRADIAVSYPPGNVINMQMRLPNVDSLIKKNLPEETILSHLHRIFVMHQVWYPWPDFARRSDGLLKGNLS
jgi:hypothetical protein